MPDPSAHDENELTRKAVGHGPVRLRDEQGQEPVAGAEGPAEPVDDAVGSIITQAQETAELLQVAAAELQAQSRADLAAARHTAREQHDQDLERARMAISSLMSHLDTVQTRVTTSAERVRSAAEEVAVAFEDLARERLQAMREQVEAASSAVDLIAAGMAATEGEERERAGAEPEAASGDDIAADAAAPDEPPAGAALPQDPAEPGGALPEDPAGSAAELLDEAEPAPDESAGAPQTTSDLQRARLAAVNLALNGTPREETAQHLADSFGLQDGEMSSLLDDVYRLAEEAG
jgi:hypothetical protein